MKIHLDLHDKDEVWLTTSSLKTEFVFPPNLSIMSETHVPCTKVQADLSLLSLGAFLLPILISNCLCTTYIAAPIPFKEHIQEESASIFPVITTRFLKRIARSLSPPLRRHAGGVPDIHGDPLLNLMKFIGFFFYCEFLSFWEGTWYPRYQLAHAEQRARDASLCWLRLNCWSPVCGWIS